MEQIVVAAIACIGSFGGAWLANRSRDAVMEYRLGELEKAVRSLKNEQETFASFNARLLVMEEQIKNLRKQTDAITQEIKDN